MVHPWKKVLDIDVRELLNLFHPGRGRANMSGSMSPSQGGQDRLVGNNFLARTEN